MFVQGLARVVIQRVEVDEVKLAVTALAVQRVFTAGPSLAAPVSVQLDYLTQGAISQSVSHPASAHLVLPSQRSPSQGGDVWVVEMNLETFTRVLQLTVSGASVHGQQWT